MSDLHTDILKKLSTLATQLITAAEQGVLDSTMVQQLTDLIDQYREHKETSRADIHDWLNKLMMFYPQLAPAVERTLLWHFGGDCLHYLTDEEISAFQIAEDMAYGG